MIPYIRAIREDDLEALSRFTKEAGFGVTTLAKDPDFLKEKISHSLLSFQTTITKPSFESYLFVLEFPPRKVVGVSAVISRIGINEPIYAYHLLSEPQHSKTLHLDRSIPVLHFIRAGKHPAEIGSLFLEEEYRKKGLGRMLSFSRFLFMASFRERFAEMVVAEMRGVSDKNGISPFYEAVGRPFLERSFDQANLLRIAHPDSIGEIFPRHPIYPWLLPKEAAAAIGHVHEETAAAQKLLYSQGFKMSHYRDFLDGGPHLYAPLASIKAIRESFTSTVKIEEKLKGEKQEALIANSDLDFRACLGEYCSLGEGKITITKETANVLKIENESVIRILKL